VLGDTTSWLDCGALLLLNWANAEPGVCLPERATPENPVAITAGWRSKCSAMVGRGRNLPATGNRAPANIDGAPRLANR
jgi:hypothetical protein